MKYDKNLNGVRNRKPASRRVEPEHLQVPNFVQTPPSQRPAAQQRHAPPSRQNAVAANSRRHKRRRKKNYILYYIIFVFLLTVTAISLSLTVFFKIEKVDVIGCEGIDVQKIITDSRIKTGENMFRISISNASKNIAAQNLTIDSVKINRKLPSSLEIEVIMATTKAELFYDGKYNSLSQSNKIIGQGETPLDDTAIKVAGSNLKGIPLGEYLKEDDKNKIEIIDKTLEAIAGADCSKIKLVDITDEMNISLYYGESFLIKAGGALDIEYKLQWAKNIIDQKLDEQSEMGIIDVSANNGHYYFKHSDKLEKPTGM